MRKNYFKVLGLALCGIMALTTSCTKDEVNDLEDRVDTIEKTSIAPIKEQVQTIQQSIPAIEQTQTALSTHVETVKKEVTAMGQDFAQ
ncbi:MAG: hypothetical protein Q4B58_06105, partial [Bacteroidales bacterium]|nr:hypothetical protein [Bacteroidales bacterium]